MNCSNIVLDVGNSLCLLETFGNFVKDVLSFTDFQHNRHVFHMSPCDGDTLQERSILPVPAIVFLHIGTCKQVFLVENEHFVLPVCSQIADACLTFFHGHLKNIRVPFQLGHCVNIFHKKQPPVLA